MSARPEPPGSVQALVILLYIGGGENALFNVISFDGPDSMLRIVLGLLYGLFYLVLARMIQLRRSWARVALLVVCGVGAIWSLASMGDGLRTMVTLLWWPVVYAVLVNTAGVRLWLHRDPEPSGGTV